MISKNFSSGLFANREKLSPFTKVFRAEGQIENSLFFQTCSSGQVSQIMNTFSRKYFQFLNIIVPTFKEIDEIFVFGASTGF